MDIFIDWGSTNFHAFLVKEGRVRDRREVTGQGFLAAFVQDGGASRYDNCSGFLSETLREWLADHPAAPILMCGAVGSREGWVQTRYVEAPAGYQEVAAGLVRLTPEQRGCLRERSIAVTSGLAMVHRDGRHDVMRSEEVKSLGAASLLGRQSALLGIPGTHCKWIRIEGGRIVDFHTIMTGDLYGVLSGHGSLAPLFRGALSTDSTECRDASFDEGLDLAGAGGDLLLDLWQVRSRELHGPSRPRDLRSLLSGILLGHELRQVRALHPEVGEVVLVADPGPRVGFYRRACERFGFGIGAEIDSASAVCAGLMAIRNVLAYPVVAAAPMLCSQPNRDLSR
jgi:2-dehydro-3-deoxygalactonokinase